MDKLCECGCGEPVTLAKWTDKRWGSVKGKPLRFLVGHNLLNKSGAEHSQWNGGVANCHGYAYILNPKHPNTKLSGYIANSKLIAEKAIGKHLPPKAIVHHINGIRDDDRNNNLVVCENQAYHLLLHQRERAYRKCGNGSWRKCVICKEYDTPENMIEHYKSSLYHRTCRNEYSRNLRLKRKGENR